MSMPTQYQVIHPPVQNVMGGGHLHTPQSIFQHMMGQQNAPHQSGPWPQMPQVPPMMMPWSVPSLQQSQLVRFTGERLQPNFGKPLHVKRKIDVPDITEGHRAKQFITEEKMAAHFQDMHISSNYSQSAVPSTSEVSEPQPCCSTSTDDSCIDLDVVDTNSGSVDDGKSMHPRLVISEELKRLQQEPMLPASLLSKLERPSMALVLWEPPSKHLRMLSTRQSMQQFRSSINDSVESDSSNNGNSSASNNESAMNNNHDDIADMNQSLMEEQSNIELEPMDL